MSIKIYASQDWVEEKLTDVATTIVPPAVNDALTQAKESGEFKGEPGQPGYTPQKDVDYFDGEPGAPGKDGGYYTPSVTTPNENTLKFAFEPSDNDMPAVESVEVPLPSATVSGDSSGIYILDDGETIQDVPADVDVAIDPNGIVDAFMPLTFTGAVNATYDGSEAVEVEIPEGGGGGEWRKVAEIKTTEDLTYLSVTEDMDGNPFAFDEMFVLVGAARASDATTTGQMVISPCPEWHSSFNGSGIYGFPMPADVYVFSAMFKVLTDGLLRMEYSPTKRIAGSLSQYPGLASSAEKFSMAFTPAATTYSGQIITPSQSWSDARKYLDENGKLRSVTIGTDLATSVKIGAGSTLEVWGR